MTAERKVKLTIAYDGSGYHGWQVQPDVETVQETVMKVLARVVKHPVTLVGASRTDTGVHAAGQCAMFMTTTPIPNERLHMAINSRLPDGIRVLRAEEASETFDVIRSPVSKLYRYTAYNGDHIPCGAESYAYHFYLGCEVGAMREAAGYLLGEHDFTSLASTGGKPRASNVRTIHRLEILREYHWIYFDIEADGFLYHMVRNIVGTLLEVGRGHWKPEKMEEILAAKDRGAAGPMAPACGLALKWIRYPRAGYEPSTAW